MADLRTPVSTIEMALTARHEGLGVRAAAKVCMVLPEAKLLKNSAYGTLRRSLCHENLKFRDIQALGKVGLRLKNSNISKPNGSQQAEVLENR